MAPIATTPVTAALVAARCSARVPPRDWPATNTSWQSRRSESRASWADRAQSVHRVSSMASGVSPWPASNGPMTSYPAAARYSPSPRISGGVPAKPWSSRQPRVPARMRNGRSWSGWGGLLQIVFVRTAITSAVYRPASSATRSGLYGPAKLSPSASGRDDRNCGGEQAMAIVGWLVALLLGIVLALFSVENQQPATINVLGASYQNIPIWVVMLASAALGALMAIVISLVDRVRWYMASRFTKKVLTEHKKMIMQRDDRISELEQEVLRLRGAA